MWTCRKCSAEVEDHFEICWSCGTGSDGSQDPNFRSFQDDAEVPAVAETEAGPKLVTVATYWVADQAQRVQALLENGGAPACIAYDFDVAHDWVREHATGSIQLQVAEEQVEQARQVLAKHATETAPLPPLPPKPPEPDEETKYRDQPWLAPIPKELSREEVLRLLESQVSALIDSKDTPDWKVNPAFHPDVIAFIQKHANNIGFVQKAQALQRNRAKYFATIRQQLLNPKPKEEEAAPEAKPAGPSATGQLARTLKLWLIVRPLRWGLRLLKWALVLGCVVLFVGFCASLIYRGYGSKQLEEAIDAIDEKEQGSDWQWKSLHAKRKPLPDAENAALLVKQAAEQVPQNWPTEQLARWIETDRTPARKLNAEEQAALAAELEKSSRARPEARKLAGCKQGRWPDWPVTPTGWPDDAPNFAAVTKVLQLLWLDAALLAQTGQGDEALQAARAILGVGRSGGNDLRGITDGRRIDAVPWHCASLRRILAQNATCSGEALAATQEDLSAEEKTPWLLAARTEDRAFLLEFIRRLDSGDPDFVRHGWVMPNNPYRLQDTPLAGLERWLWAGKIKVAQRDDLRAATDAVEWAKLPVEQQVPKFKEAAHAFGQTQARMYHYLMADLRCSVVALAAERYRLATGAWPASLADLVPKYLPAVPVDLYDGKPLRYARDDEGVVIWSVGPDGHDDGGKPTLVPEDRLNDAAKGDIAFRLWNPERRGQAPP
ncbi:MAG: hypothetical protein JNM56_24600 [Planctomycetia bacterium]|nr:hypothetical protein [Planctomycetia bacterium]